MCLHNCTKRYIQSNTRISRGFADYQVKKMNDAMKTNQEQAEAQAQAQAQAQVQVQAQTQFELPTEPQANST